MNFIFPTDLVDSYEKYPESVVSGLTKIGGILALVRIVQVALFYLHRYLFEKNIKKQLNLKDEGEEDFENNSNQLKVRYSIESYEKLLVTVEDMHKSHEDMRKSLEEVREREMKREEDTMNGESHDKAA